MTDFDELKTSASHEGSNELTALYDSIEINGGDVVSHEDIESIRKFIDKSNDDGAIIDFTQLMKSVYDQRVAKRDERGIYLDPIDDQQYIAQPEDLVGFMRPDQVMMNFEGLLDADNIKVIECVARKLAPEFLTSKYLVDDPVQTDPALAEKGKTFLIDHADKLLLAGLDPNLLVSNLPADQLKENKDILLLAGASKYKVRKQLAKAAIFKR